MKPKHFILSLVTLFVSITASAHEWTDDNGTVWNFTTTSGNTATIIGGGYPNYEPSISGIIPENIIIPTVVYFENNAYQITSIGYNAFNHCSSIKSIIVPNGVTSIGQNAFSGCSSLTSINIPDGVTFIGTQAFYGCSNLTAINIPDGITSIQQGTFQDCNSLTSIIIPDGVVSIGISAFNGCYSLTTINVPDGVKSIESDSFYECLSLTAIHFSSSTPKVSYSWPNTAVLFVPDAAVSAYKTAWTNYAHKVVPETSASYVYDVDVTAKGSSSAVIDEIGEENAYKVVKLKVSGTFNSYDVMAFRNKMINLQDLDLSDANVVGSNYCYYSTYYTKDNIITGFFVPTNILTVKTPKDITALEPYAFSGCQLLRTITIPDGITSIPDYAFDNCQRLTNLTIPESVTSIYQSAFAACYKISSLHLPSNLKTLGALAFAGCPLTEIHLPPYLESIGDNAFSYCNNLKDIYAYMPDIIPIGTRTFDDYQHQTLYVPEFLYNNYYYDTNWSQFLDVRKAPLSADDYEKVPTNSDIVFADGDERIPDMSTGDHVDGELNTQGSFTVEGDDPQPFNIMDQELNGTGQGGSLIGTNTNLTVNHLNVKIAVQAGRWYFFCFPFDVTISNCEYPGQYAWRYYDGAYRASNGSGGWKPVAGATLTARQGYAFQSSTAGTLVVKFENPTFGGNRPKELVAHASENAANASWNFVGNPYSSFYDFLAADFTAPITVWNGTSYTAYRPGDDECHLQPYEAFFVQKPSATSEIAFNADRRETYRKSEEKKANRIAARRAKGVDPQRRLINLEIMSGEDMSDRTRVVLNNNAAHAYEIECDAAKFLSNDAVAQLYSVEGNVQMAINERPQQGDIRLGYVAKKAGTLSISASRMDMPMVLVDTQTGTTFDLTLGSYDFETTAGTFNGRFLLRISDTATAINRLTTKTGVCIGTQDGGIAIGGAEGKTINIYATNGTQAAQHSGNGFVNLTSGVYVVTVDGVSAKVSVK